MNAEAADRSPAPAAARSAGGPGLPGAPAALPQLLVLLGVVLAAATILIFRHAFVDDAYISLRYAQSWLGGHGLVFNPGERVEGFTNLGHVLLVSALGYAGLDLQTAARLLGLAGLVAAVVLGPRAVLPRPEQALERALARALLLSNFAFVYFAWTGLETTLYTGVVSACAFGFARSEGRIGPLLGLGLGLAFCIRPDGLLVAAALGLLAWRWHGLRPALRMPGVWTCAAGVAAVEAGRFAYYGALVPNTALVKGAAALKEMAAVPWYGGVGDDVVELLSQTGGALALIAVLVALVALPERRRVELAVALVAAVALFELYANGDWMLGYRFLQPMLPLYLALSAAGLVAMVRAVASRWPTPLLGAGFGLGCAVVAVYCWSFGLQFQRNAGSYPEYHMTSRLMVAAAQRLAERYPPGTTIAAPYIGALGYFTKLDVIDTIGLTDAEIARAGGDRARRDAYLTRRAPRVVLSIERPGPDLPRERAMYGGSYRFVEALPMADARPWLVWEREPPKGAGS